MKKLLIIYGSYGSGHKTIAEAIASYFSNFGKDYEIKLLDVTKYSNISGKASIKLFDLIINHRAELMFNFCYELVDNKVGVYGEKLFVKRSFDNKRMRNDIKKFNPDITISTHYFGGSIITYYNKINLINSKIVSVITDYVSHSFWLLNHKDMDAYIVANEVVKKELVEKGVLSRKIYPYGLPFDKTKLLNIKPKNEIIKTYKINQNKKTYIFFGGGSSGSMAYYDYFKSLAKKEYPINLIFICGKNKKLEHKAKELVKKKGYNNVIVLGFVKDVFSLLNVADFVISKPGGATVTESIIMKTPLITIPGVGGQEKYNAKFVEKKRFGLNVRTNFGLNRAVRKTMSDKYLEKRFKRNLEKVKPNESLENILNLVNKMTDK